jgi:hypothetical protein
MVLDLQPIYQGEEILEKIRTSEAIGNYRSTKSKDLTANYGMEEDVAPS